MPDLRPLMVERMRALRREVPLSALAAEPDAGPWLEVEVATVSRSTDR